MTDDDLRLWLIEQAEHEPADLSVDAHRRNRDIAMGYLHCLQQSLASKPDSERDLEILRSAISENKVVVASHVVLVSLMQPKTAEQAEREPASLAAFEPGHITALLERLETWVRDRSAGRNLLKSLKDRATIAALNLAGRLDQSVRDAALGEAQKHPEAFDRWLALCFGDAERDRGRLAFAALFPPNEPTTFSLLEQARSRWSDTESEHRKRLEAAIEFVTPKNAH